MTRSEAKIGNFEKHLGLVQELQTCSGSDDVALVSKVIDECKSMGLVDSQKWSLEGGVIGSSTALRRPGWMQADHAIVDQQAKIIGEQLPVLAATTDAQTLLGPCTSAETLDPHNTDEAAAAVVGRWRSLMAQSEMRTKLLS